MDQEYARRVTYNKELTSEFFFCDNKITIDISHNLVYHDKTKHIEVDRHFKKEKIEEGILCKTYVPMSEQVADIFTK